jgi:dihydrofolate reductase
MRRALGARRLRATAAAAEVERLRQEIDGDLAGSGPNLAATLASHGLIDEYRLVVNPVLVGGGKSYFPRVERTGALRLVDSQVFSSGALYLRYRYE